MSIEIKNISKVFMPEKIHALNNVSIKFKKDKITGLISFNGSGKTIIFNILSQCLETKKSTHIW